MGLEKITIYKYNFFGEYPTIYPLVRVYSRWLKARNIHLKPQEMTTEDIYFAGTLKKLRFRHISPGSLSENNESNFGLRFVKLVREPRWKFR